MHLPLGYLIYNAKVVVSVTLVTIATIVLTTNHVANSVTTDVLLNLCMIITMATLPVIYSFCRYN